jgi:signal transduction histidine kinase
LVSSTIRDIVDRKHFERIRQEKSADLAEADLAEANRVEANRAEDQFLARMSHELRTPLNAIIGFTGTLLMKLPGPLTGDQENQLRTIQKNARHLLALINDLLDVARIEAGNADIHLEPIDCKAVIDEVAASLRPQAEFKGLSFQVQLPEDAVAVRSDRRALSQIVTTLVNNAIRFTERGSVRVSVDRRRADGKDVVEISVRDTGQGIRPEDKGMLFAAFARLNTAPKKAREGTGLGLHLSQKLAELLGGKITFASEYGQGSTFTFALPGQ